MEGADGHFSGLLQVGEDGTRNAVIMWDPAQTFEGAEWGTPGVLRLNAWWTDGEEDRSFDRGRLRLLFEADRKLPEHGYFDFGAGPSNGTFVVSFSRFGDDKKSASASLDLSSMARWARGQEQLHWTMQGGRNGVGSGKWVTSGVLPTAFLRRLESDFGRFRIELLAKGGRPEKGCEKRALDPQPIVF